MEENLGAIAKAVNDDLHTPYTEAVLLEVWDVIAETIYFQKNLESFTKKEKLPTPLNQRPLSFEVLARTVMCVLPVLHVLVVVPRTELVDVVALEGWSRRGLFSLCPTVRELDAFENAGVRL